MKAFLLLAGCFGALAARAAGPVLENDALAIRFAERASGFAVTSVVVKAHGTSRFVHTEMKKPDFWEIVLVKDGGANPSKAVTLQNHTPSKARLIEPIADGLAFTWKGLSIPGADGERECVDVRAEVLLKGAFSEWRIAVDCRSRTWALLETRYPYLRGVVTNGEADVLMPFKNLGARVHRAYDTEKGDIGTFGYPGWYPTVAAYMKDGVGLYLAAHDGEARNRSIVFGRGANVSFHTPVENAGVPGKAAEGPRYAVTLAAFAGDWWQAAHIYRDWALTCPWCAKGKMAFRKDFPRAAADTDLWILGHVARQDETCSDASNRLARARAALPGLDVCAHLYGWNVEPFDTHYPEFLPKPGFRDLCEWMGAIGIRAMPYLNGRLYDQSLASAPYARGDACRRPDGAPAVERYNNRSFAVMCPYAPAWQRILFYNATNVVFGSGTGALYYDQITCSRPQLCFNPAHGHPLGGGNWWAEGYRAALAPMHAALAERGIPLTSEGTAEAWIDGVDALLNWTTPMEGDVPFYPAVYSGYTVYFGTPVQGCDSPETLFMAQARALAWGVAPGWVGWWTFDKGREAYAAVLRQVAEARHAGRAFLAYGTLEGEARVIDPLPPVSCTWRRLKRTATKGAKKKEFDHFTSTFPAVLGTLWKNAAGTRTALVAVNFTPGPVTARFALDAQKTHTLALEGRDIRIVPLPQ